MPDASPHCKRPALDLGVRWSNAALRGHPTTGPTAEPGRPRARRGGGQAFRNGTRQSLSQASPCILGPAQRLTHHCRAAVEAVTRGRRRHAAPPRWTPSVHSPQYRGRLGSATIVASLRSAASASEPPSPPKHSFNPTRGSLSSRARSGTLRFPGPRAL
jgi:hypothetical protein